MGRRHDERGIALPSPVAMVSLGAVVLAGVAFVTTSGDSGTSADTAQPVTAAPSPTTPLRTAKQPVVKKAVVKKKVDKAPPAKKQKEKKAPVRRGDVYVEVYNNSGITGLAGATANTIAGAGWQVVGSDNWYGTIPASTVYFPERLRTQGLSLARDLGIARVMPAISPMRFDRLTVILTSDFS